MSDLGASLFIGIEGTRLSPEEKHFIRRAQPGGFILFARNLESAVQTHELLQSLQASVHEPCFLSIDQEGGRVDRLKAILPALPPMSRSAERGSGAVRTHARLTARALRAIGFNMNFAPVLDLLAPIQNGLGDRCFAADPVRVARFGAVYLRSTAREGIPGTLKHFPGLGHGECDSHVELPVIPIRRSSFFEQDLLPFRRALCLTPFVMVAHAFYPEFEEDYEKPVPASLSRRIVTRLLRKDLQFRGIALTDDLLMGALRGFGDLEELSERAMVAGEDMLLICRGLENAEAAWRFLHRKKTSVLARIQTRALDRIRKVKRGLRLATHVAPLDAASLSEVATGIRDLTASIARAE